jgi:16S rRNA (guanine(966)-N(2))-methyltransferase RsmD
MSMVMARLDDLGGIAVLDLYAGSGALGIEALSRGAAHVTFVERDRQALACIRNNLDALEAEPERFRVVAADVDRMETDGLVARPVALLFADPPYTIEPADVARALTRVAAAGGLTEGALVVYEHAKGTRPEWPAGFREVSERVYGDTAVTLAVYEGGP